METFALRLLGPVQLHVDGEPVPLGGPRRRALLAFLGVHRGFPVPADRLIDALWGDTATPGTRHALHTHVCALRRALRLPQGSRAISHGAGGYQLSDDRVWIDVDAFERGAGDAIRRRDPEAAERTLGLWRGDPLTGLASHDWAAAAITSWYELRRQVASVHLSALLQAGEHDRVLLLTEALLPMHPHDERLWAQRLLALYRVGRQIEALAAYHELHRRLRDDLGVEPGPQLIGLQRRILLHDAGMARRDAPPHRVPAPISSFVGRQTELTQIAEQVHDHRLVTITGPAGVGKSRLAEELADQQRGRMDDGVFLVDLAEVCDGDRVPAEIIDRMGLQRAGDALEDLSEALSGRAVLLVLDGAEHLRTAVATLAVSLLRRAALLHVLVASRVPLGVTGEVTWRLAPLELPQPGDPPDRLADRDAVRLFVHRMLEVHPAATVTDRDLRLIATICERLDGLPLAIELAAGRSRATSLPELMESLQHDLGGLRSTDPMVPDRHRTLAAALHGSTDLLDRATRGVFTDLAVVPGRFDRALASAVCRLGTGASSADGATIDEHLARLVDHSLLMVETDDDRARFRMLDVVRDHAMSLVEGRDGRARAEAAALGAARPRMGSTWPVEQATEGVAGPPVLAG